MAGEQLMETVWTFEDNEKAREDGWLVCHDGAGVADIQRHDEGERFDSDAEAIAHVYWMAGTGSTLHRRAIFYTLRESNRWAYVHPKV